MPWDGKKATKMQVSNPSDMQYAKYGLHLMGQFQNLCDMRGQVVGSSTVAFPGGPTFTLYVNPAYNVLTIQAPSGGLVVPKRHIEVIEEKKEEQPQKGFVWRGFMDPTAGSWDTPYSYAVTAGLKTLDVQSIQPVISFYPYWANGTPGTTQMVDSETITTGTTTWDGEYNYYAEDNGGTAKWLYYWQTGTGGYRRQEITKTYYFNGSILVQGSVVYYSSDPVRIVGDYWILEDGVWKLHISKTPIVSGYNTVVGTFTNYPDDLSYYFVDSDTYVVSMEIKNGTNRQQSNGLCLMVRNQGPYTSEVTGIADWTDSVDYTVSVGAHFSSGEYREIISEHNYWSRSVSVDNDPGTYDTYHIVDYDNGACRMFPSEWPTPGGMAPYSTPYVEGAGYTPLYTLCWQRSETNGGFGETDQRTWVYATKEGAGDVITKAYEYYGPQTAIVGGLYAENVLYVGMPGKPEDTKRVTKEE
jgi:hypothetical protein